MQWQCPGQCHSWANPAPPALVGVRGADECNVAAQALTRCATGYRMSTAMRPSLAAVGNGGMALRPATRLPRTVKSVCDYNGRQ
jgi:hypothetical protein